MDLLNPWKKLNKNFYKDKKWLKKNQKLKDKKNSDKKNNNKDRMQSMLELVNLDLEKKSKTNLLVQNKDSLT